MSRAIEIIDPEGERRLSRQRWILFLVGLISLSLFGYPEARDYYSKWQSLRVGREFALRLSRLRAESILGRMPREARFRQPNLVEIYRVSSCGPFAERTLESSLRLNELGGDVEFAPEPWVREHTPSREPYLPRFCYDPL